MNEPQEQEDDMSQLQTYKESVKDISEELICPITCELPVNPVIAEDGRIYDEEAIESWIRTRKQNNEDIKSPITNKHMGCKLIPAIHAKNIIRTIITKRVAKTDITKAWIENEERKQNRERLRKKLHQLEPAKVRELLLKHIRSCSNNRCYTCNKLRERIQLARLT